MNDALAVSGRDRLRYLGRHKRPPYGSATRKAVNLLFLSMIPVHFQKSFM